MCPRDEEKDKAATSLSDLPQPEKSKSTVVPYPSPPGSPRQRRSPILEIPKASKNETRLAETIPPKQPFATTAKPDENKDDVLALKSRLGLDDECCAALTKAGRPCKQPSPATKDQIVSHVEPLITLTQSSLALDSYLDRLATLVHCRFHDCGIPKMLRIDAWLPEFPLGENGADLIASRQIRKALRLESTQCLAVASKTRKRCRLQIGGQSVQHCSATIAEIVKPDVYLNDIQLDIFLRILETHMRCSEHGDGQDFTKVDTWKLKVAEIRGQQTAKAVETDMPTDTRASSPPSNIQSSERPPTKTSRSWMPQSGGLPASELLKHLSNYSRTAYDDSAFQIIEKSDGCPETSYSSIEKEILRDLDPDDHKMGHIYAYEVPHNPGYVKIGYTTSTVEKRLKEWKLGCNRVPKVLFPKPSSTVVLIPHARRVEALCHAELGHRRIRIYCKNCLKQHLEWFETPAAEAVAAIKKWSKWMASCPYELTSEGKSTIKRKERKKMLDMGCFMREISEN